MIQNKELIKNIISNSNYIVERKDKNTQTLRSNDNALSDFCEFLAKEFSEINAIKHRLNKLAEEKTNINKKHKQDLLTVDVNISNVQDTCKHLAIKHYADPSGGYDSYDVCEICGKEINKTEYRRS